MLRTWIVCRTCLQRRSGVTTAKHLAWIYVKPALWLLQCLQSPRDYTATLITRMLKIDQIALKGERSWSPLINNLYGLALISIERNTMTWLLKAPFTNCLKNQFLPLSLGNMLPGASRTCWSGFLTPCSSRLSCPSHISWFEYRPLHHMLLQRSRCNERVVASQCHCKAGRCIDLL